MHSTSTRSGEAVRELARTRRWLLWVFAIGTAGTGIELLLVGHIEGTAQWVPIVLLTLGLGVALWHAVSGGTRARRVLRTLMIAFLVSGPVGVALHYDGNVEFELEMYPQMTGTELFREAMTGATPVLAPGTMTLLGLIGWIGSAGVRPGTAPESDEA